MPPSGSSVETALISHARARSRSAPRRARRRRARARPAAAPRTHASPDRASARTACRSASPRRPPRARRARQPNLGNRDDFGAGPCARPKGEAEDLRDRGRGGRRDQRQILDRSATPYPKRRAWFPLTDAPPRRPSRRVRSGGARRPLRIRRPPGGACARRRRARPRRRSRRRRHRLRGQSGVNG